MFVGKELFFLTTWSE